MRLLLDTHIMLWALTGEAGLRAPERDAIMAAEASIMVSAAAIWEVRLKWQSLFRSGTRKLTDSPQMIRELAAEAGWPTLSLTAEHAATVLTVPLAHKDPFDELLVVQAQVEGLRLLTRDPALRRHPVAYWP